MVQDNVLYTYVGGSFKAIKSPTDTLTEGDFFIELEGWEWADNESNFPERYTPQSNFRIVRVNKKGVLEKGPWMKGEDVIVASKHTGTAITLPTGIYTPEAPAADEETLYSVWIVIKDSETTFGNKAMMKNIVYKAVPGDVVADVVAGLKANFDKVMAREPYKYLTASEDGTKITFTGAEKPNPTPGLSKCEFYEFEILPGENGAATHTAGVQGDLLDCQIKEDEWFAQGNRGYGYRVDVIPVESQLSSDVVYAAYSDPTTNEIAYLK